MLRRPNGLALLSVVTLGSFAHSRGFCGPPRYPRRKKSSERDRYWLETSRAMQSETLPPSVAHSGSAQGEHSALCLVTVCIW
jgi:hypothetical protein